MKITQLYLCGIFILIIITIVVMIVGVTELNITTNRVKDSVTAAALAAFSEIDFSRIAERNDVYDEEDRNIFLLKGHAETEIRKYIKKNLCLDSSLYPTSNSYILLDSYPIIIDEITIYNPDELPTVATDGTNINRTSIFVSVQFPINIKFLGDAYKKVEIIVDSSSFYTSNQ